MWHYPQGDTEQFEWANINDIVAPLVENNYIFSQQEEREPHRTIQQGVFSIAEVTAGSQQTH